MLRPNHTILDLKTLTDVDYFLPVLDAWSLGVAVVSLIVTAAAALFTLVTVRYLDKSSVILTKFFMERKREYGYVLRAKVSLFLPCFVL